VAPLFQVLSLMAVPAAIVLTIRYFIVRQNRLAREPSSAVTQDISSTATTLTGPENWSTVDERC
jgi:hypothetical protein